MKVLKQLDQIFIEINASRLDIRLVHSTRGRTVFIIPYFFCHGLKPDLILKFELSLGTPIPKFTAGEILH